MPRQKQENQRIRDERRQELVRAATSVFAVHGYSATRIEDIAVAAHTSKGLVYHYFNNKDAIFATIVQRSLDGALRLSQYALQQEGGPWEQLHWLITQYLKGLRESPERFLVILQALTNKAVSPQVRALAEQQANASWQIHRYLIVAGQERGQVVAGDPDRFTTLLSACLQGLAVVASTPNRTQSSFPDADDVLRFLKAS